MFETGFLQIGRIRGAPIRIHWSVLLGVLFFTGFRFAPAAWLGFVALVLVHELGHAGIVLRYGLRVLAIDVHGFGGQCRWEGQASPWQRAVIAWGGVLAQAALLAATLLFVTLTGGPTTSFGAELVSVFTHTNAYLALINLLPIPPLDGANAWTVVSAWRARRANTSRASRAREELRRIEAVDRDVGSGRGSLSEADANRVQKLFDDALRRKP
jgi:stage IV sporulation protein FB